MTSEQCMIVSTGQRLVSDQVIIIITCHSSLTDLHRVSVEHCLILTTLHLPLHQAETRHDEQLQHAPPQLDQLLTVLSLLQTEQYLEVSSGWTGVVEESVDLGAGEERQESGEC